MRMSSTNNNRPESSDHESRTVPEIIPLSQLIAEITEQLTAAREDRDQPATSDLPVRLGAMLEALEATGAGQRALGPSAAEAATSIMGHPAGRHWPVARTAERAITMAAADALYDHEARRSPSGIPAEDAIEPHRAVIHRRPA